jgi:hypothetical protein
MRKLNPKLHAMTSFGANMAANRNLKLLSISNFFILLTQAYESKLHRAVPKYTMLKDCIGLSMDGSFSERYELILPVRSHIVIFRSSLEAKFKIARAYYQVYEVRIHKYRTAKETFQRGLDYMR